ncbi:MAG: hypothetical protein K2I89_08720 [Muribaculaceae bacterium]|nr:hypothetical protein [Muribaculaceae bacterium]
MKRISLIAAFVLASVLAFAQIYKLTVTKTDGNVVTIPTEEISKIEFIEDFDGDPELTVTPQAEAVPFIGGDFAFAVNSNCSWSYTVDNSTVREVSKTRTRLVLNFPWKPSDDPVKYTVTFNYGGEKKQVVVEQSSTLVADLLDIKYNADGTAEDISPLKNKVLTYPGSSLITYYNDMHKRYVANFRNQMGMVVTSGYYRVNYTKGGDFINNIADGCTFETIIKLNEADDPTREVKWFSSMQGGGIGFILPHHSNSKCMTFLPNISTNGASKWCWTFSNVQPEVGKYYHVVGVYNKEEGKSYIYINGRLSGQAATPGDYVPVANGAESFIIGGDPGTNQTDCDASFNGEVVTARIFSAPMTADQVAKLWKESEFDEEAVAAISVSDIVCLPQVEVASGYKYSIYGNGFENGDVIELFADGSDKTYRPETIFNNDRLTLVIPADMVSGSYRLVLKRGSAQCPLAKVNFSVVAEPLAPKAPKIVSHRGAHLTKDATENSIAALKYAMDANYYAIELDVHRTTDDVLVVHHDGVVNGKYFSNSKYDEIKDIKLANGENLPTFDSFINTFVEKMGTSTSKLIIEIKPGGDEKIIDIVMDKVEKAGIKNRVEYISFGYSNCKYIVKKQPDALVGYLAGDRVPANVLADGIKSVDYSSSAYASHPTWIKDARKAGMIVNVWTINSTAEMLNYISQGVDYITTDYPAVLRELTQKTFIEPK